MSETVTQMKLKEWIIAQVDSGRYLGLLWENKEKTIFRIPWKHASKQDYKEQEDAAIFKAWAIYKRKYQEGMDRADPSTWKTRLRCALNKSTDFEEIPERSQLDISEPYKVYRVLTDTPVKSDDNAIEQQPTREETPAHICSETEVLRPPNISERVPLDSATEKIKEERPSGVYVASQTLQTHCTHSQPVDVGCQVKGIFYSWTTARETTHSSDPYYIFYKNRNASDFWLHIRLYYCDVLVKEFTTRTVEGCRITHRLTPADIEQLNGPSCVEELPFPQPQALSGCGVPEVVPVLERLLAHLNRGVLLWVSLDGVFAKRQCQGRVYWSGPMAPRMVQPNKLEREKEYKLLDTQQFLQELRVFLKNGEPAPRYQIRLCFGEEFPETAPQNSKKLITAHVEPVFARELFLHAQQIGSRLLHSSQLVNSGAPDSIISILKHLYQS